MDPKPEYFDAKHDQGKDRWDLLDLELVHPIVAILTYGSKKYAADSWKKVPNGEDRYWAAMMRHLHAFQRGEIHDPESGWPHLWHAACNMYFLLWFHYPSMKRSITNESIVSNPDPTAGPVKDHS